MKKLIVTETKRRGEYYYVDLFKVDNNEIDWDRKWTTIIAESEDELFKLVTAEKVRYDNLPERPPPIELGYGEKYGEKRSMHGTFFELYSSIFTNK